MCAGTNRTLQKFKSLYFICYLCRLLHSLEVVVSTARSKNRQVILLFLFQSQSKKYENWLFGNLNIFGLQDFFTAFLNALERIFMMLLMFSQLSKIILLWLLV
jgi:hypothetical protein